MEGRLRKRAADIENYEIGGVDGRVSVTLTLAKPTVGYPVPDP
jgi:hypothetical protein